MTPHLAPSPPFAPPWRLRAFAVRTVPLHIDILAPAVHNPPMHEPTLTTTTAGSGRWRVSATAIATGDGVTIHLGGGERPHVGAVAIAIPRPSLRDPARTSATSSVITVTGHKDDELAKPLAELAAARLGQVAVVVVGVHVEGATDEDIERLAAHAREAVERLLAQLA